MGVVRAGYCVLGLVMQTKLLGLNLVFRALTSAAMKRMVC